MLNMGMMTMCLYTRGPSNRLVFVLVDKAEAVEAEVEVSAGSWWVRAAIHEPIITLQSGPQPPDSLSLPCLNAGLYCTVLAAAS